MTKTTGSLYVVATPLGNLADLSERARTVLGEVDWIAVEDTRRTRQLLTRIGLQKRLLSLHEHNEKARIDRILELLGEGRSVALVSDAGTPLISDPGYRLVAALREQGLPVVPVPGPCAAIAALSVAGLPSDRFRFEGFLPAKAGARRRRLGQLAASRETLIFYESPARIDAALADMAEILGADRPALLARELTKLYETFYRDSLRGLPGRLAADPAAHKGELTLVVGGRPDAAQPDGAELERVFRVLAAELPPGRAAALAAKITGARRAEAYRLANLPGPD